MERGAALYSIGRLSEYRPEICASVVRQAEVNASAMMQKSLTSDDKP